MESPVAAAPPCLRPLLLIVFLLLLLQLPSLVPTEEPSDDIFGPVGWPFRPPTPEGDSSLEISATRRPSKWWYHRNVFPSLSRSGVGAQQIYYRRTLSISINNVAQMAYDESTDKLYAACPVAQILILRTAAYSNMTVMNWYVTRAAGTYNTAWPWDSSTAEVPALSAKLNGPMGVLGWPVWAAWMHAKATNIFPSPALYNLSAPTNMSTVIRNFIGLFIMDSGNHAVRFLNFDSAGIIVVAGTLGNPGIQDGVGGAALLSNPMLGTFMTTTTTLLQYSTALGMGPVAGRRVTMIVWADQDSHCVRQGIPGGYTYDAPNNKLLLQTMKLNVSYFFGGCSTAGSSGATGTAGVSLVMFNQPTSVVVMQPFMDYWNAQIAFVSESGQNRITSISPLWPISYRTLRVIYSTSSAYFSVDAVVSNAYDTTADIFVMISCPVDGFVVNVTVAVQRTSNSTITQGSFVNGAPLQNAQFSALHASLLVSPWGEYGAPTGGVAEGRRSYQVVESGAAASQPMGTQCCLETVDSRPGLMRLLNASFGVGPPPPSLFPKARTKTKWTSSVSPSFSSSSSSSSSSFTRGSSWSSVSPTTSGTASHGGSVSASASSFSPSPPTTSGSGGDITPGSVSEDITTSALGTGSNSMNKTASEPHTPSARTPQRTWTPRMSKSATGPLSFSFSIVTKTTTPAVTTTTHNAAPTVVSRVTDVVVAAGTATRVGGAVIALAGGLGGTIPAMGMQRMSGVLGGILCTDTSPPGWTKNPFDVSVCGSSSGCSPSLSPPPSSTPPLSDDGGSNGTELPPSSPQQALTSSSKLFRGAWLLLCGWCGCLLVAAVASVMLLDWIDSVLHPDHVVIIERRRRMQRLGYERNRKLLATLT